MNGVFIMIVEMTQTPTIYYRFLMSTIVAVFFVSKAVSQVGPMRYNNRELLLIQLISEYYPFIGFENMEESNIVTPAFNGKNILLSTEYEWSEGKIKSIRQHFYKDDLLRVSAWYAGSDTENISSNRIVGIDSFFYDSSNRITEAKYYHRGVIT
jgi:hypothetical protein